MHHISRKTIGLVVGPAIAAVAAIALAGGPAFASTPGNAPTSVPVSATVTLSCGFSTAPGSLSFGGVTPGEAASASTSFAVQCNDNSGYEVFVTDAGPTITGNNGTLDDTIYTGFNSEKNGSAFAQSQGDPFTAYGNPFALDNGAYSATPVSFTDNWQLTLPNTVLYPGTVSDTFAYQVFGS